MFGGGTSSSAAAGSSAAAVLDDSTTAEGDTAALLSTSADKGYKEIHMRIRVRDAVRIEADQGDDSGGYAESQQRRLRSYLALPIESYSLLNPSWISRTPSPGHFKLRIPLHAIVGINLEPSILAEVVTQGAREATRDPSADVTIVGHRAATGSKIFDDLVEATFTLSLSQQGGVRERGRPARTRASGARDGARGAERRTRSKEGRPLSLEGRLLLNVAVRVPAPLSAMPAPALKAGGATLIRLVVKRMLAGFLQLLANDFEKRQQQGEDTP